MRNVIQHLNYWTSNTHLLYCLYSSQSKDFPCPNNKTELWRVSSGESNPVKIDFFVFTYKRNQLKDCCVGAWHIVEHWLNIACNVFPFPHDTTFQDA